jgi:hypothetical protein
MNQPPRAKIIDVKDSRFQEEQTDKPFSKAPLELSPIIRDMMAYGKRCYGRGSLKIIDYVESLMSQLNSSGLDPDRVKSIMLKARGDLQKLRNEARNLMTLEEDD